MSEKKKFSYASSDGDNANKSKAAGEEKKPARHRQDLGDIARQTGIEPPKKAHKHAQEIKAAAPAKNDPFSDSERLETVRRLREERVQRAGEGAARADSKTEAEKPAAKSARAGAGDDETTARARKKAADESGDKTPKVGRAEREVDAKRRSVADDQLELVKKMDRQKAEGGASEWKGQPASGATGRVSGAAARASFSSLAPAEDDFARSVSRALDERSPAEEFTAADDDFGEPKRRAKAKTSAKEPAVKGGKTAKKSATKKSSAKKTKREPDYSDAPKKKSKALLIALCSLGAVILLAVGAGALYFTGVIDLFPQKVNSYQAADHTTFMKYLTHPSLRAGDSIAAGESVTIDIDNEFGGFVSLPLVEMNGVTFENGIVLFLGGANQSSASLDGVTFNNCEVYIDAAHTDLKWSGATNDRYINCATLNGSAHLTDESFPIVGAAMKIPVTLQNSGAALTNAEVTFSSPSYIFTEGETYLVDSIPANSSVSVEVPVIAVEGGRTRIYARDTSGAVSGDSGYVDIVGTGYVSGDLHTHSKAGVYKRYSTIPENVEYGYRNGLSFIVSVENFRSKDEEHQANEALWAEEAARREKEEEEAKKLEEERKAQEAAEGGEGAEGDGTGETVSTRDPRSLPILTASAPASLVPVRTTAATTDTTDASDDEEEEDTIRTDALDPQYPEKLEQSKVDEIVGGSGRFLQITGNETGYNNQHMLILKANVTPRSDYMRAIPEYGTWTYQAAVDKVVSEGGIVILPHFFDRDVSSAASMIKSLYDITALEIMSGGRGSESVETRAELQAWDAINAYGMQRLFAVMSSNNFTKQEVGTRYTSGLMGRLTEANVYRMLESGDFIATNGPTVRFELGGAPMGGMTFVSAKGDAAAAEGDEAQADEGEGGEPTVADEQAGEVQTNPTRTQAKVYACDDSPLTRVQLIKYAIKTVIEDPTPEYVLDVDLTGQGVYVYSAVVDLDVRPGEFYRFEARSESDDAGDDVGVGLANPIWVYDSGNSPSGAVSASGFDYKMGGEVVQTANNRWCLRTGNFIPMLFNAHTTAAYTDVAYHKRDSANFPDSVTVYMLAPDGKTSYTETLYILDK